MRAPQRATLVSAALVAALCGCGDGTGSGGGTSAGGTQGTGGVGGTTSLPELGSFDRANISYANNLLQKVEDEEWTLEEGLVATLRVFAGELDAADVLRYPELNTYEGTGVFMMARRYLREGPDTEVQNEIARLLRSLEFSIDELEQMAGLSPASAPLSDKGVAELCRMFFDDFDPPGVSVCLEVESVTIGENEHRIFFPASPLPMAGWDETSISMAVDALADSIPVFDAIGDIPAISIVYSVKDVEDLWGNAVPDGAGECGIAIYTGLQSEPQERFQQLLAHEIAHCFQGQTWPAQHALEYEVIKWHFEGAAEYWSNVVYPEVNLEWRHLPNLERWELVSYLHNRDYENFIFFQYLASTIGNAGIADVVAGLPGRIENQVEQPGIPEQRGRLADYPNMEQIFHDFTQALTDGAVEDTGGGFIPYVAPAYDVELFGPQEGVISVPLMFPFATYRFLISADEGEKAELSFDEGGTISTSARRASEGVSTAEPGIVNESIRVPGLNPWSASLPTELPEEECDSASRMVLATTSANPTTDGSGEVSGASIALDVTDVDNVSCCLHGQWVMNNQDLAAADTEGIGLTTTYSGQLSADYRPDGTVLFVWGGLTRVIEDIDGASTAVITGGGTQFYQVPSDGIVVYPGPELTVSVDETAASGQSASFTAVLDTALGDFQSTQFFECSEDTLVTVIRGDDAIGWRRMGSE